MSTEAPVKKDKGSKGLPAWVMTFADLMTLLMTFFVLLLSFAEMDIQKFKQVAGSMKMAFGVQRDIKVKEMPKGTSVIAREFSPGRPTPTPMDEVRQNTIDETRQTLEFTDAITHTTEEESMDAGERDSGAETAPLQMHTEQELSDEAMMESGNTEEELQKLAEMIRQMNLDLEALTDTLENPVPEDRQQLENIAMAASGIEEQVADIEEQVAELIGTDREEDESQEHEAPETSATPVDNKTLADAEKLLQALAPEIEQGLVTVETEGNKIVIRIKEKGSFPSGSSELKGGFMPVIGKLRDSLNTIEGKVIVAGHTDNVPIKTARFRSNWELSSSRAVTVVHELLENSSLDQKRFAVEGHGDTHPIVANDTDENRATNRRVELTIIQGEEAGQVSELSSFEAVTDRTTGEAEPAATHMDRPGINLPVPVAATTGSLKTESANPDQESAQMADDIGTGSEAEETADPEPESSAETGPEAEESSPITGNLDPIIKGGIEPLVRDPFADVMKMKPQHGSAQEMVAPDNVTINAGELKDRLKSIMDRLNTDETEKDMSNE